MEDCCSVLGSSSCAANALLPKVLYVRVITHVWLAVERCRRSRASATRSVTKCHPATDKRASQPWSQCAGVPVVCSWLSTALCGLNVSTSRPNETGGGTLNRLQFFRDKQGVAVVQATENERVDQCFTRNFRQLTGLPAVAYGAAGSSRFDRRNDMPVDCSRMLSLLNICHICSLHVNLH